MRAGDILRLEMDKNIKGKAEVLFLEKVVDIKSTDTKIYYWVCKLISGNVPNDNYQVLPQRGNGVQLIRFVERLPGTEHLALRVLHKAGEVDKQQCPECKGLGHEEIEKGKTPAQIHTSFQLCSNCGGSGWIRVKNEVA